MHSLLLLAALSRVPLPIPDSAWSKPAEVRARERREPEPAPPPPAPPKGVEDKRVGISLGVGALIAWPSLEVEVLPAQHVAAYVSGEASLLAPGYGVQAGVRLRPMKGLIGPWLDVHVRHSRYAGLTFSHAEELSPGVALGVSLQSKGGFLFSAGLGASFLVQTTRTTWGVGLAGAGWFPVPFLTATTSHRLGVQPEVKLQVGWAF